MEFIFKKYKQKMNATACVRGTHSNVQQKKKKRNETNKRSTTKERKPIIKRVNVGVALPCKACCFMHRHQSVTCFSCELLKRKGNTTEERKTKNESSLKENKKRRIVKWVNKQKFQLVDVRRIARRLRPPVLRVFVIYGVYFIYVC